MVSNLKPLLFYGSKGLFSTSREDDIIIQIRFSFRTKCMGSCHNGYMQ